ncbi:MAG: AbrB/MazE/SpoVT family DNA-binding domain-containing protein [Candidatus Roizmanbacteria bacterium]|uniref:SpoVT-AbrB domain-containing protein n=2 Tax=Candidatus Roizmaniibacteriota TaxID=1752723 RepID=A0A2M8EW48_9BACT|nr:AbrB/MazE/SpoVT family DNA-binding domain-containing protein [Candidatus Roizmanbacteria bacterium]PIZ65700.1 MAG: hypothetical protein COY15_02735 [Candidatus Roizmanbacteria bacterium CG_4_10_14_0_2_um_filter_39_12]PJC30079.1 MAG: hypothetical protein CO051_07600 [Candidatus Roizmanbacteria bacterium CG_4_9_14_0_2_um_filter_39_13]PJE61384.1 MAG: hypothetical protein COU87_04790 [Candidatus Roizmanbacteria bacterium CG10_big_fil_rev_8_21_14_0_10_39_12]
MQTVTITSQGQVTIPKDIRDYYGITASHKATVEQTKEGILFKPRKDFWSAVSILASDITASDEDLRNARKKMVTDWPRKFPWKK